MGLYECCWEEHDRVPGHVCALVSGAGSAGHCLTLLAGPACVL